MIKKYENKILHNMYTEAMQENNCLKNLIKNIINKTNDNTDYMSFIKMLNHTNESYTIIPNTPKQRLDIDEQDNECYIQIKLSNENLSFYFDEGNKRLVSIDNELDY